MAGSAGRTQLFIQLEDRLHILFLSGSESGRSGVDQELGVFRPTVLIPGAAAHQQQIPGFAERQRGAANHVPIMIILGWITFNVEQCVGSRVDDIDHQLAHVPDRLKGRRRLGRHNSGKSREKR